MTPCVSKNYVKHPSERLAKSMVHPVASQNSEYKFPKSFCAQFNQNLFERYCKRRSFQLFQLSPLEAGFIPSPSLLGHNESNSVFPPMSKSRRATFYLASPRLAEAGYLCSGFTSCQNWLCMKSYIFPLPPGLSRSLA